MTTPYPSRTSGTPGVTWDEAFSDFLVHLRANRAEKTVRYYRVQVGNLAAWAEQNQLPLDGFGKRHMDRYLAFRKDAGCAQLTLQHDAVCAKAFLKWCAKNDLLERNLLSDYQVRHAASPPKHMPTDEEVRTLLRALHAFWDKEKRPAARYQPPTKRSFHRDRNYALVLFLIDSACRIGEGVSLKLSDVDLAGRTATVRESKGRKPRAVPLSPEWCQAAEVWLKVRRRVMGPHPDLDEGWFFVTETGGRLDEGRFLFALKHVRDWAELSDRITLHSLRRYSLNKLAKHNLLMAQQIAGHRDAKTTLIYTQLDPDFLRDTHREAGVVRGVLEERRPRRKRLV